jgi:hypothetical protein
LSNIDSPIIILSAPRAGSTLLFETLSRHPELWTIGGESHALIEHMPEISTVARGYVSNRLERKDATADVVQNLRQRFINNAVNSFGEKYSGTPKQIRLLEKTPKNALRVEFLNEVFPDARFIYLIRDPLENISSIMEAWRSKRFVTYPNLPGWTKNEWSLLLSDDWRTLLGRPLVDVATHQWLNANTSIVSSLNQVSANRVLSVNYQDLISSPYATLEKILTFTDLDKAFLTSMHDKPLPLSKYTLTPPKKDKWLKNHSALVTVDKKIKNELEPINRWLMNKGESPLTTDILSNPSSEIDITDKPPHEAIRQSRNGQCECGSGKRFKHCHGKFI